LEEEFIESATPTTYQRVFLFTIFASENYFVGWSRITKRVKLSFFEVSRGERLIVWVHGIISCRVYLSWALQGSIWFLGPILSNEF